MTYSQTLTPNQSSDSVRLFVSVPREGPGPSVEGDVPKFELALGTALAAESATSTY